MICAAAVAAEAFRHQNFMRAMAYSDSGETLESLEIPTENFTSALNYFLCIDACSRHERKRLVNGRKSVRKKLINIRDGFPSAVSDVSCTVSRQLD